MFHILMQIANVDRALTLIEALAEHPQGASLGALASELDLPKSAAHRLLRSLESHDYVMQDPVTQSYRLSLKLGMLGFRLLDASGLPDLAQGVVDRLAAQAEEYCRLALVEGRSLRWVARAQGAVHGLRYDPPMGREAVLHATASGKAWLSTLPEDEAAALALESLSKGRKMGPRAARNLDELRRQLRETRRRGYALAMDEAEDGIVALAVPFRASPAPDASTVGTLSIAGPGVRLGRKRIDALAPVLAAAAAEMAQLWPMRRHQPASMQGSLRDAA